MQACEARFIKALERQVSGNAGVPATLSQVPSEYYAHPQATQQPASAMTEHSGPNTENQTNIQSCHHAATCEESNTLS